MQLTETNEKILSLMSEGKSVKEVASELFLSHRTIENKLAHLRAKNNCKKTVQLLVMFLQEREGNKRSNNTAKVE